MHIVKVVNWKIEIGKYKQENRNWILEIEEKKLENTYSKIENINSKI